MKRILTLPTWQVFVLLMLPAFFSRMSYIGLLLSYLISIFIAYCIYYLANSLYERLPAGHDLNINRFYFNAVFAIFYMVTISIIFDGHFEINQDNYKSFGGWIYVIIPLHIFAMYCLFYGLYFIAKSITTVERQKRVGFDEYAGNFFLLWFFPFGYLVGSSESAQDFFGASRIGD
jgi:hypothetical protein